MAKITASESNRTMADITFIAEDWDITDSQFGDGIEYLLELARQHGHNGAANKFEQAFGTFYTSTKGWEQIRASREAAIAERAVKS